MIEMYCASFCVLCYNSILFYTMPTDLLAFTFLERDDVTTIKDTRSLKNESYLVACFFG